VNGEPTTVNSFYAYDADDQLASQTDALGRVTTFDYDSYGHLLDAKLNGTTIESCTYDLLGNRISETDGDGNHVHFYYDALNRLAATSIPLPATQAVPANWWTQPSYVLQATTYDAWGEIASTTKYTVNGSSVQSAVTTYAYDNFGRKISENLSASETLSGVEGPGLTITFSYDAADNLLTTTYPPVASSGQTLPTTETLLRSPYNASLIDAFEDRSGHVTNYSYDEALRQREITTSLGGVTDRTFDALGRIATKTDPAGTTSYAYDLFNHPVQVTDPDNVPGTNLRIETFAYDNFGKLITKSGAGEYPMTYSYDAVGNLSSMTDANNHQTQWTYTDRNQVATKTYADGASYTYTYDGAGNLQTRQDALSRLTTYTYTPYNLPLTVTYPTDPAITFTYDQQGDPLSMTDGSGVTTWIYDSLGNLASETQAASHRTLNYSYDAYSNRTGMSVLSTFNSQLSTPESTTTYGYDNAGRLQSILDSRLPAAKPFTYTYAANSNLVSQVTSPTGLKTLKTYDNLGRLVSIAGQQSDNSTINSFTYSYDAAGQRIQETALDYQQNFTYDAQRELTQASKTLNSQLSTFNYSYDGIGNRQTVGRVIPNVPTATFTFTTNAVNQYTAITKTVNSEPTTVNPVYDANGNTTSLQGMTLVYDEENRLVEVSDATSDSVYTYDGLGRRVETKVSISGTLTSDTLYVYDGRRVIEELDENYTTLRSYTRGLDLSGSLEGAGGIGGILGITLNTEPGTLNASYFYDGNGNVIDLVGDDGSSQAHYQYSPFGDRLSATGSLADINPYQFSSKERDVATGFYYYGQRYYNPGTGRWLSRDPINEEGHQLLTIDPADILRQQRIEARLDEIQADFLGFAGQFRERPMDALIVKAVLSKIQKDLSDLRDIQTEMVAMISQNRWLNKDPFIETLEETNLYAFVGNNSINRVDPDGRFWWVAIGAIIGGGINAYEHWSAWQNGCISNAQFWGSVGEGAAFGALSTLAPGFGGGLALGAATSLGNSIADQEITTGQVDLGQAAKDTAWGVVGGTGAYFGGKAVAGAANRFLWNGVARSDSAFGAGYNALFNTADNAGKFTGAAVTAASGIATTDQQKCGCKK
jgi:RHS repeat-associated protein